MQNIRNLTSLLFLICCFVCFSFIQAQTQRDAAPLVSEQILPIADSTGLILKDSVSSAQDSINKKNSSGITETLHYMAKDSIYVDMKLRKAFLFQEAHVDYEGSELSSNYMVLDFEKQEVLAQPTLDSLGKQIGIPHFKDATSSFDAKEILYNFDSKRGLIKDVLTQESELYVHGKVVKKENDNTTYIKGARFTSCDLDHPHFDIRSFKAKLVPDDKIVIGSAMMFIEDIPTPLVLPFGIFPASKRQSSGIIIPFIGQTARQGFFFKGLGYYLYINDYMDLKLDGDAYTGGNWELRGTFRYAKRYKFRGGLSFGYSQNFSGPRGIADRPKTNGIMLQWSHAQDAKAHPNSTFSANVNFKNSAYTEYTSNLSDYLTNTTSSNITYQLRFAERYNLSLNAASSYNTNNRIMEITLPSLNFSIDPIYPFRRKKQVGKAKWYETISLKYNMQALNKVSGVDTLLFRDSDYLLENMSNGMKHNVGISSTVKILKHLNWNNSVNYNEYWYLNSTRREYNDTGVLENNQYNGFHATRDFSLSSNVNFKMYGILRFKKGNLKALRHVITPSVGLSYHPDFGTSFWGNYRPYINQNGRLERYSIYEKSLYGGPSSGKAGNINFSIGNTFDMKVRDKSDSSGLKDKNVSLIDQFNLSTSYNMAADSLRWSPLALSLRTTLFKTVSLQARADFDFYKMDSLGRKYDEFFWVNNSQKGLRFVNSDFSVSFSWNLNPKANQETMDNQPSLGRSSAFNDIYHGSNDILLQPVNYNVPWNVSISYTLTYYLRPFIKDKGLLQEVVQTVSFSGSVSITPKWQISFGGGFDFVNLKPTIASINFTRDLHCWEMGMYWVPYGSQTQWNFFIRIRSSVFQDIKYEKRKDPRDNVSPFY